MPEWRPSDFFCLGTKDKYKGQSVGDTGEHCSTMNADRQRDGAGLFRGCNDFFYFYFYSLLATARSGEALDTLLTAGIGALSLISLHFRGGQLVAGIPPRTVLLSSNIPSCDAGETPSSMPCRRPVGRIHPHHQAAAGHNL
jgi:hypothetical protein